MRRMLKSLLAALRRTWPPTRKCLVLAAGAIVVLAGVALLILPVVGSLAIPAGLAILAIEFHWARRPLLWVRSKTAQWTAWIRSLRRS